MTVRRFLIVLMAALGLATGVIGASPAARALEIPARPDGYITDRADMLSAATREKLEQSLAAFEKKTTTQIVVATFPGWGTKMSRMPFGATDL